MNRATVEAALRRHEGHREAERWGLPFAAFADTVETALSRAAAPPASADEVERAVSALHLADLALACACAEGIERAWAHFIEVFQPGLRKAADAMDPTGSARDLADGLYAELYGLTERDGRRRSHFRYYHGRSRLGTWLRAVLAQRFVDRIRVVRRHEPLEPDDGPGALTASPAVTPVLRTHVAALRTAIATAVADLAPRDRLRLTCYHAEGLTLAQIGRTLGEHEATVSRHLARARQTVRTAVERRLREEHRMSDAQIAECVAAVAADSGALEIRDLLGEAAGGRKPGPPPRSR